MRFAIVENGIVVNVVEWDRDDPWQIESGEVIRCADPVGIGWSWAQDRGFLPATKAERRDWAAQIEAGAFQALPDVDVDVKEPQ